MLSSKTGVLFLYICFCHPQFMRLSRLAHPVVPWQMNKILIMCILLFYMLLLYHELGLEVQESFAVYFDILLYIKYSCHLMLNSSNIQRKLLYIFLIYLYNRSKRR